MTKDITVFGRPPGYDRFRIARDIQDACNPAGVAHELLRVIQDAQEDKDYTGTTFILRDAAVRAVVDKLASLCGVQSYTLLDSPHRAVHEELERRERRP